MALGCSHAIVDCEPLRVTDRPIARAWGSAMHRIVFAKAKQTSSVERSRGDKSAICSVETDEIA